MAPASSNYLSIYSFFLCILIYEMILLVGLSNKLRLAALEILAGGLTVSSFLRTWLLFVEVFECCPFLDKVFLLEESFVC